MHVVIDSEYAQYQMISVDIVWTFYIFYILITFTFTFTFIFHWTLTWVKVLNGYKKAR